MSSTPWLTRAFGRLVGTCALLCLAAPAVARAQGTPPDTKQTTTEQATCAKIADQLGARLAPYQLVDLPVGLSLNATLADPGKLAKLGIAGMHEGARVTVMRIAPDRLRVEVDEMEPVPLTKKVTLKVDGKGDLSAM